MFIHDCIDFSVFLLHKRSRDINIEYNKYNNIILKNQCKKLFLYIYLQLFTRRRERERKFIQKIFTDFYECFFLGKMESKIETSKIETIATMFSLSFH